jgi:hypothetical protein
VSAFAVKQKTVVRSTKTKVRCRDRRSIFVDEVVYNCEHGQRILLLMFEKLSLVGHWSTDGKLIATIKSSRNYKPSLVCTDRVCSTCSNE